MTRPLIAKAFFTTALTSLAAGGAIAQNALPILDAELIAPLEGGTYTSKAFISGDASSVYATSYEPSVGDKYVSWTRDGGSVEFPITAGAQSTYLAAVNGDGSVVVATRDFIASRWSEATGWQTLSTLGSHHQSYAQGISRDGRIVVGFSYEGSWGHAVRWVDGQAPEALLTLGPEGGLASRAYDVSDDGSVVVGALRYFNTSTTWEAFRWVEGSGSEQLGFLENGTQSYAEAVSADGSVIVGKSHTVVNGNHVNRAFRWTEEGGMQSIGTLGGEDSYSEARDVNADGTVIVGYSESVHGEEAFRWVQGEGMTGLGFLEGGTWSFATGVSDDGSIVVGTANTPDSNYRAFVWGGGPMLDHENTMTQIATNAHEQANAMSDLGRTTEFVLGQELIPGSLPGGAFGGRVSTQGGGAPYAIRLSLGAGSGDDTSAKVGGVTAAKALAKSNVVLGGYLGLANEDGSLAGLDVDGTLLASGLWLRGNPGGAGLTWKLGLSHVGGDATILRDASLPDTEAGFGETDLSATSLQAEIGYGMERGAMRLTPFAGLRKTSVSRDGYTETDAVSFPITYDDYEQDWTVARLGLHADMAAGASGQLRLSAGVDVDLDRSDDLITGTSDIPGMTTFAVAGAAVTHDTRGFVEAKYLHWLGNGAAFDVSLGLAQSAYGGGALVTGTIGWQRHF